MNKTRISMEVRVFLFVILLQTEYNIVDKYALKYFK